MNSSQSSSICLVCKEIIGNSKLITCSSCAKIYHQVRKFHLIKDCLLYTEDEIKKYSISKCDVCRTPKEQTNRIRCFICNKNDGILKKIRDKTDRWGHIGCVKYFFIPLKFENGFTFFKLDKALPDDTWIGDCSICSKSSKNDFLVKCNKQSCNKYFHSKCLKNKPTLIDSLKEGLMTYCIVHCDEHKSLKKTGDKLQDVKTYGKNINNTEGNFNSNSQLTTR